MNGTSLKDWRWLVNAINERSRAIGRRGILPIPQHLRDINYDLCASLRSEMISLVDTWAYVKSDDPIEIEYYNDDPDTDPNPTHTYQTGREIVGRHSWETSQGGYYRKSIYNQVRNFGTRLFSMTPYSDAGEFMNWIQSALRLLTKTSEHLSSDSVYSSAYIWNMTTGNVEDYDGVTVYNAGSYSDFYQYALDHTNGTISPHDASVEVEHYQNASNDDIIRLELGWREIYIQPCCYSADITVYISATGNANFGWPVTTYDYYVEQGTYQDHWYVHGFTERTFQNVMHNMPVNIGFSKSNIANPPQIPALYESVSQHEDLGVVGVLCDFAPYFQY